MSILVSRTAYKISQLPFKIYQRIRSSTTVYFWQAGDLSKAPEHTLLENASTSGVCENSHRFWNIVSIEEDSPLKLPPLSTKLLCLAKSPKVRGAPHSIFERSPVSQTVLLQFPRNLLKRTTEVWTVKFIEIPCQFLKKGKVADF